MSERFEQYQSKMSKKVAQCRRFCYAARAKEYQKEAIEQLSSLLHEAGNLKAEMIVDGYEDAANKLLSMEEILKAVINELKMWIDLKNDDPNSAWTFLIHAQTATRSAIQAHSIAGHLSQYAEYLYALEKILFPPQLFTSAGMIIKKSTCSVCGTEYGDCDHIAGKAYMGELCARIIEEGNLREVSVVPEPANKHCRMLSFSDSNGTRDIMTWRLLSEDANENTPEDMKQHYFSTYDD